jgi:hypothetical protein
MIVANIYLAWRVSKTIKMNYLFSSQRRIVYFTFVYNTMLYITYGFTLLLLLHEDMGISKDIVVQAS